MTSVRDNGADGSVCTLTPAPPAGPAPDGVLLERFRARKDPDAFAALVERYGPLVLSVCRRVLQNLHDAEDAFQATFLVLVRKAGSIGKCESVGSWLYKVAYRISIKAKAGAARRYTQEMLVARFPVAETDREREWNEIEPVLDEEVNRLPEKYRQPFVLCYLQGKTYEEVARQLATPKGTISTRLNHAREQLRTRLVRRGVALTAGTMAFELAQQLGTAAVPARLAHATTQAALQFAAGHAAAGAVSAHVAILTEGVVRAMWLANVKAACAGVAAATLVTIGAGTWADSLKAAGHELTFTVAAAAPLANVAAPVVEDTRTDREKLQGVWNVVSIDQGDRIVPEQEYLGMTVVVKDDKMTMIIAGKTQEFTFTLNEAKQEIDATEVRDGQSLVHFGIYELNGDSIEICNSPEGRPTQFATKEGARWPAVLVLSRQVTQ